MVRIKHRYLLLNILYPNEENTKSTLANKGNNELSWAVQFRRPSSDQFNGGTLHKMIKNGVSELFGDYGAGMIAGSLQIKYCSPATSTAIVRVAREHYRLVWAALSFATRLPKPLDQPCVIQVVRVSGTIKKAEEEAIRRARLVILRAQKSKNGPNAALLGTAGDDEDGMEGLAMTNGIEDRDDAGEEDEDD
ncbi:hypothetical protein CBER1_11035 [Cercospora berteroae]|uniref:Ribonuclease P/MRP protein subunit POP5 n=1 Tax=Cercospora berteroae TaxID=357750 RepID=A0A2S6CJQ4_9PEZI|nr:hypothetical protein CBER1_11035 [Cercospora berteroae]